MRTAVDSSVIWTLIKKQSGWDLWKDVLSTAALEGQLVMCPVTFAECSSGYKNWSSALEKFQMLQIQFDPISPDAAFQAGQLFKKYRQQGGKREHLISDFIIATHALCQADRLAATDRGFYRTYFPALQMLHPE